MITFPINESIIGPGSITLDLNNDNIDDFTFDILTLSADVYAARVLTPGLSRILDNSTFGYPDTLNYGSPVEGYFNTGPGVLGTFNNAGQFNGAGNKYLGIRINDSGSDYLGWIELNCSSNRDTLSLIAFGYNAIPGASIFAGQTSVNATIEMEETSSAPLIVFPNPIDDYTVVTVDPKYTKFTLTLINSLGQAVQTSVHSYSQRVVIDRNNLPSGAYVLSLSVEGRLVAREKVIIRN